MSKRILCFGELLLRLSSPGRELLLQSPQLQVHVGGAEANVAVSLQKLGHSASVLSAVPSHHLGDACLAELRRHAVDVTSVLREPGRMGLYFLTQGAGYRPAEVLYDRADSVFARIDPNVFDWPALLRSVDWLHVSGVTPAVSATASESALRAVRCARQLKIGVSFDCNFRSKLWSTRASEAPAILRELASHADVLFGDHRDIDLMFGIESQASATNGAQQQAANIAFERFPHLQWLAATHRNRETVDTQEYAASLHTRSGAFLSRNYPLSNIVDRIGAGDAFAAGVIDQYLQSAAPDRAVEFACAAAVLKHSIVGDFNLATRAEIEAVFTQPLTDVRR